MGSKQWQTPKVVFQPEVYLGMQRGINQVVDAIRPTLGPCPRLVAIESTIRRDKTPELLDSGGLIARRVIQIQDRDADVGAMYIRHMLWQLHEKLGDGTATAAVIFQSIFNRGVRYIAAGGNAMLLRIHLERAAQAVLDELDRMTVHLRGKENLAHLAETLCYDPALARILGEVFDTIGEYGRLEIRPGRGRELEHEYIDGMYWDGGWLSRLMVTDQQRFRAQLEDASVLISDLEIDALDELISLLEVCVSAGVRSLLLIANKITDRALSVLLSETNRGKVLVLAVKTPGKTSDEQLAALEDLSALTGGFPLLKVTGASVKSVKSEQLGWARRVWADQDYFGVTGGKGDPGRLRQHIACLRELFAHEEDEGRRNQLQERIGKLMGGCAVLWVGDTTPLAVIARQASAERTAKAMRGAMREGVVPGGGVACLACSQSLQSGLGQTSDFDQRLAYQILIEALEEPMRTLLHNAGYDSSEMMAKTLQAGAGYGFDLSQGRIVDMLQAGICDSVAVVKAAVCGAVHAAALALTTDVLVHRRNPQEVLAGT
jgi:chaperonin GroEL